MTPKFRKYVDQERQNNFSCKRENTLKSMEFMTLWTLIWHLTVQDTGFGNYTKIKIKTCAIKLVYHGSLLFWYIPSGNKQYSILFYHGTYFFFFFSFFFYISILHNEVVYCCITTQACADPEIFMRLVIFGHKRGGSNPPKIPKLPFFR